MIRSFRHAGLEEFFKTGSKRGIQPAHAAKLAKQLLNLNNAAAAEDMNIPGWGLHPLRGKLQGHWSIRVNGNWRITFFFEGTDATLVDYLDYH
jgi:proteic killer suppression protein